MFSEVTFKSRFAHMGLAQHVREMERFLKRAEYKVDGFLMANVGVLPGGRGEDHAGDGFAMF